MQSFTHCTYVRIAHAHLRTYTHARAHANVHLNTNGGLHILRLQEDERDAPPLKSVPEPLETMVSESTFPCGPCRWGI